MAYDDLVFYLPAFGSFALLGVSALLGFLLWRAIRAWKRKGAVEKSPKT